VVTVGDYPGGKAADLRGDPRARRLGEAKEVYRNLMVKGSGSS
jgi:hypothetical protein